MIKYIIVYIILLVVISWVLGRGFTSGGVFTRSKIENNGQTSPSDIIDILTNDKFDRSQMPPGINKAYLDRFDEAINSISELMAASDKFKDDDERRAVLDKIKPSVAELTVYIWETGRREVKFDELVGRGTYHIAFSAAFTPNERKFIVRLGLTQMTDETGMYRDEPDSILHLSEVYSDYKLKNVQDYFVPLYEGTVRLPQTNTYGEICSDWSIVKKCDKITREGIGFNKGFLDWCINALLAMIDRGYCYTDWKMSNIGEYKTEHGKRYCIIDYELFPVEAKHFTKTDLIDPLQKIQKWFFSGNKLKGNWLYGGADPKDGTPEEEDYEEEDFEGDDIIYDTETQALLNQFEISEGEYEIPKRTPKKNDKGVSKKNRTTWVDKPYIPSPDPVSPPPPIEPPKRVTLNVEEPTRAEMEFMQEVLNPQQPENQHDDPPKQVVNEMGRVIDTDKDKEPNSLPVHGTKPQPVSEPNSLPVHGTKPQPVSEPKSQSIREPKRQASKPTPPHSYSEEEEDDVPVKQASKPTPPHSYSEEEENYDDFGEEGNYDDFGEEEDIREKHSAKKQASKYETEASSAFLDASDRLVDANVGERSDSSDDTVVKMVRMNNGPINVAKPAAEMPRRQAAAPNEMTERQNAPPRPSVAFKCKYALDRALVQLYCFLYYCGNLTEVNASGINYHVTNPRGFFEYVLGRDAEGRIYKCYKQHKMTDSEIFTKIIYPVNEIVQGDKNADDDFSISSQRTQKDIDFFNDSHEEPSAHSFSVGPELERVSYEEPPKPVAANVSKYIGPGYDVDSEKIVNYGFR